MSAVRAKRALRRAGFWLSVLVIVSPAILVFLWMLSLSLKTEIDNLAYPPVFIPNPPTFGNFLQVELAKWAKWVKDAGIQPE